MRAVLTLFAGLALSQAVLAAPASVEAVQFPAWIEHAGVKKPLHPGIALVAGDRITTGPGARVYLQLPEGSRVKLGENASFVVDKINTDDGKTGVFRSALNVIKGAFRFTTDAVAKNNRREVDIRVATVTAGIRGTDLWGKAADDKDLVCLLEGKIAVKSDGQPEQQMDQALTFYVAPKGGASGEAPPAVAPVDMEKLKLWAAETDLVVAAGENRAKGGWRVSLAKPGKLADALALYDQLRASGYPARIRTVGTGKNKYYRVQLVGYVSEIEAQGAGQKLQAQFATPAADVDPAPNEKS
ncbi:hypothetical protein IGB42_04115 [Andreprevotia sp. IGB-42]|uniref:FecR domain-containing protein n=1 Tax=Andreprevotia sp. IGB-42 TaxID=2497473 RepID=UPI00135A7BA9|nr:FecR domain-containing protein [Andreprevotia sp. IGB-42]KAF0811416.1 hypothetical protein IGB42_04115 [Andreprevotia sp. IGB-42]